MDKEDVVYIHNGIYSAIKHGNLAIYNNMEGSRGYVLSEISQRKTNTVSYQTHRY